MKKVAPQALCSLSQECTDHLVTNGWWFSRGERTEAGFGIEIGRTFLTTGTTASR